MAGVFTKRSGLDRYPFYAHFTLYPRRGLATFLFLQSMTYYGT